MPVRTRPKKGLRFLEMIARVAKQAGSGTPRHLAAGVSVERQERQMGGTEVVLQRLVEGSAES